MPSSASAWLTTPLALPRSLRGWLTDDGSLTARLKARCPDFAVQKLVSRVRPVNPDERGLAGLRGGRPGYVREVFLMCDGRPAIYAHSVASVRAVQGAWRGLKRQGLKPLGETLFVQRGIRRFPLSYRRLSPTHPLHRRLVRHFGRVSAPLWARRSLFLRAGAPLWVTEVFLPAVFELAP